MQDYEEVTQTIEVPKNVGVEGFLRTVREILRLEGVQQLVVSLRGQVTYKRLIPAGFSTWQIGVDFEGLEPSYVIRHGTILEVVDSYPSSPAVTVAQMYDQLAIERLTPVCWAVGAATTLYRWFHASTGYAPKMQESFYGLPVYTDRAIPDSVVILCAGLGKNASLVDCHRFIKLDTGNISFSPLTTVDVL